jgi:hypothetical protein
MEIVLGRAVIEERKQREEKTNGMNGAGRLSL